MAILTVKNVGGTTLFSSDNVKAPQMEEASLIADVTIPGRHGGITQFLGSRSYGLRLEGILIGSGAKTELDKLKAIRISGEPVEIILGAHGQTWVDDFYTVEKLEWAPRAGRPAVSGGEQVDWNMQLKQYVA